MRVHYGIPIVLVLTFLNSIFLEEGAIQLPPAIIDYMKHADHNFYILTIGGSRGACPARAPPHLPGILVFETYFFQFHALFT